MDRRSFLTFALANGAAVLAAPAFAAPKAALRPDGSVTRLADRTTLRIAWSGSDEPASIFVSNDPAAPRSAARLIKADVRGGAAETAAPVSPRPYFLVATRDGGEVRLAERLLPLEGGRNFRDLGGYRAEDGRQVRWGRIFRSGVMSGLTASDLDYLGKLGVGVICDLRSPQERAGEPSPFLKSGGAKVIAFDYDMSTSLDSLARLKTREEAIAGFAAAYVGFIDFLTPHYREMFAHLVEGGAPLAMNCSAGKDRTGVGSALVLSVLGVPRETVAADYALTQTYTPPGFYEKQMAAGGKTSGVTEEQAKALMRLPKDVLQVVMGSDPEVMRQALAGIDRKYGGPVALAKARFGLTDAAIARLRGLYLI